MFKKSIFISCFLVGIIILTGCSKSNSTSTYHPPYQQPTYTYQPTPTYTYQPTSHNLAQPGEILQGDYWEANPFTIQAGKTITISWRADGNVNVWILTQTQYDYFKTWGTNANYAAKQSGTSGTLTYHVADTDTYYLVVHNPGILSGSTKIYSAVATW